MELYFIISTNGAKSERGKVCDSTYLTGIVRNSICQALISTAATRRPCAEVRSVAIRGGRKAKRPIFAADEEGIESVGAVGAVFKEVFFGLRQLLAGFVFAVIAKRFRRRNPLRPLDAPTDCTARIKSSLFERLMNGMRRGHDACIASFSTRKIHP